MAPHSRSLVQDTVILIDISFDDYRFSLFDSSRTELLSEVSCPACLCVGKFARHGSYKKFFFASIIQILRVRCCGCRVTHALIPGFSLPGTTIGTDEAEKYLLARADGVGRTTGSRQLRQLGMDLEYPKKLDQMFVTAVARAKALFPDVADPRLPEMEWVAAVVGSTERPLWELNRFSLAHQYNCICFCRASIIRFKTHSAGNRSSHNKGSTAG